MEDEDEISERYYSKPSHSANRRIVDFTKEIRCQLYGFGDDPNPYTETVNLVEELVIQYITEVTKAALDFGKPGKISLEDLAYVIRNDKRKATRAKELIYLDHEIKKARKGIEDVNQY